MKKEISTAVLNTQYQVEKARVLRKNSTEAEKILWNALRNRKINNLKFRRQHPLSNYVVDFCCEKEKMIIEIDGSIHDIEENKKYDKKRENELKLAGYKTLRFKNSEIMNKLSDVIKKIIDAAEAS